MPNHPPSSILHPLPPNRLLVRGVNWLGDAVMTTPALLRLREALPDTRITLLTHEKLADLWTHHPAVDSVLTFSARDNPFSIASRLREQRFDAALLLPNSARAALEAAIARIPRRIGYSGGGRSWLLTQAVPRRTDVVTMHKRSEAEIRGLIAGDSERSAAFRPLQRAEQNSVGSGLKAALPSPGHHIHHYLHLTAALGANPEPLAPRIEVTGDEVTEALRRLAPDSKPGEPAPLFGLVPGAEYGPAKRWPAERFVAAAVEIHRRTNCRWLLLGGKADAALCSQIADEAARVAGTSSTIQRPASTFTNLAGRTTLRELCALLRACRVVLTNDTGPMHLAAAVGTPVVALFGSTSPELTGPGLPGGSRHQLLRADAPCSPCFLRECPIDFRCMTGLDVTRVVEAVTRAAA